MAAAARSQEGGAERILPRSPQEGTNPADASISNVWPPKLQHDKFLLFTLPGERSFVLGAWRS